MVQYPLVRLAVHRRPSERVEKVAVSPALLASAVAWTGGWSFADFEERGVARDVAVGAAAASAIVSVETRRAVRSTRGGETDPVVWHLA